MNRTLVTTFLRQRAASPMRMILLLMLGAGPLLMVALTRSLAPLAGVASQLVLLFAAGAIGQDVSSGVLQLTFARPVSRPSYVVSRWLAASLATAAVVLAQVVIGSLIMAARGMPPDAAEALRIVLENTAVAFAGAAVMLALSAYLGGLGDLGVLFLGFFSAQILSMFAAQMQWNAVAEVARFVTDTLFPHLDLRWLFGGGSVRWAELAAWASTLTLGLAVAIHRMNRRELSYAAD